jgi:hypothetical protein
MTTMGIFDVIFNKPESVVVEINRAIVNLYFVLSVERFEGKKLIN